MKQVTKKLPFSVREFIKKTTAVRRSLTVSEMITPNEQILQGWDSPSDKPVKSFGTVSVYVGEGKRGSLRDKALLLICSPDGLIAGSIGVVYESREAAVQSVEAIDTTMDLGDLIKTLTGDREEITA